MTEKRGSRGSAILQAIAYRPSDGEPMIETEQCQVLVRRGLIGENRKPGKREVTLLAAEAWADVCRELGVKLPWYTRRANLLVGGLDLASAIGRKLAIGDVRIWVHGESKPCRVMDEQHDGLRAALASNGRGGVFAQVLTPGTIHVGDIVTLA